MLSRLIQRTFTCRNGILFGSSYTPGAIERWRKVASLSTLACSKRYRPHPLLLGSFISSPYHAGRPTYTLLRAPVILPHHFFIRNFHRFRDQERGFYRSLDRRSRIGIAVGAGVATFLLFKPLLSIAIPIFALAAGYGVYRFVRAYLKSQPTEKPFSSPCSGDVLEEAMKDFRRKWKDTPLTVDNVRETVNSFFDTVGPAIRGSSQLSSHLHSAAISAILKSLSNAASSGESADLLKLIQTSTPTFTPPIAVMANSVYLNGEMKKELRVSFKVAEGRGAEVIAYGIVDGSSGNKDGLPQVILRRVVVTVKKWGKMVDVDIGGGNGSDGVVDAPYRIRE